MFDKLVKFIVNNNYLSEYDTERLINLIRRGHKSVYCFQGQAGCGKTSLIKEICNKFPKIYKSNEMMALIDSDLNFTLNSNKYIATETLTNEESNFIQEWCQKNDYNFHLFKLQSGNRVKTNINSYLCT